MVGWNFGNLALEFGMILPQKIDKISDNFHIKKELLAVEYFYCLKVTFIHR